ncbi:LuxR C-terminal-related transcriptional regulator [Modestobacter sp. I12A-02662]|uniref:helix-turn-helix transcriptional regulator n=1 Tax=Modestobacter sp. I12A-02662 TaxID=1730496 RepID=UPI0034DE383A
MTAGRRDAATGWAVPAGAADLLRRLRADEGPRCVLVQGAGGTGKTLLLAELAAAWRAAGVPVTDLAAAPLTGPGPRAVLVDDAQRLTPAETARLRQLLGAPGVRVAVAARPWPRPAGLLAALEEAVDDRAVVVLGHLSREAVQRWVTAVLGAVPAELGESVARRTGGLPVLVADALRRGAAAAGKPSPEPGELLRSLLALLPEDDRSVLHALVAGAPADAEVLAEVLEVAPRRATELLCRARATGLLLPGGTVVPVAAEALLAAGPADVTRAVRRRLLGVLLDRGEDALPVARAMAADRVRDRRGAALLAESGSAALGADPALAGVLLDEAAACGAPPDGLAARRAAAAALTGDLDTALRWADCALADDAAPDRARAAGVAAAVLARRGLLADSAELLRLAGPDHAGSAAVALLGLGATEGAAAVLASSAPPTLVSRSERLAAAGLLRSLRPAATDGDVAAALSDMTRAAGLLEPVGQAVLLPDTPAALAAVLALHTGELTTAEEVLERALAADVGGPNARVRHLLLRAWTAMLRGSSDTAGELLARGAGAGRLEPRDELVARALEAGLARRASDRLALGTAWAQARQAVLRHPVDLFSLLPLGELVVAGARLTDGERLAPHLAEAQALLARLGDPPVWAAHLHWSCAQAAVLTDTPAALEPHAAALQDAGRTSPYAAAAAAGARCWHRLLAGEVDAAAVTGAATGLAAVGLAWDGSRLAGQAAARAVGPADRAGLLQCARSLAGSADDAAPSPPSRSPAGTPAAPGLLSQRERDVAELVVAGQTYNEIGGRLYISAKTVEHHVSRMRQRLGASTRSDLLARLRAELAQGA